MGVAEIIVIVVCSAIVIGTVIATVIRKKKGKGCCDCSGCTHCTHCQKEK